MKKVKYIFLSPSSRGKNCQYYDLDSEDFFVGSWAGLLARRLKAFKPELDISVWRMEPVVKKPYCKKLYGYGIDGIIWPEKKVILRNIFSLSMYFKVLELSLKYKIIIHYHSIFDRFVLLRFLLPSNVKIVLSHHGGIPPEKGSLKDYFIRLTYKYVSAITYLTPEVREYLLNIKIPSNKMYFLPVGADFNFFMPSDKQKAREKLKIPQDFVFGIYVGSFYRLKSVDLILRIYDTLKLKYNFKIIFVGGENNEQNDLYNDVKNSGCPFFGKQKYKNMHDFYNASDFYIHPTFNPSFGGFDVSWIEALACNRPVLSTRLKYLDFDYSELGVCLYDENEIIEKTEWMINNYKRFTKCRETAQKYLDGNTVIMEKLSNIYEGIYHKSNSHNDSSSGL